MEHEMSVKPIIQTEAKYTKAGRLTLAELQQFLDATAEWPRDTKVKIVSHDGQRDGYSITISATLGGAK